MMKKNISYEEYVQLSYQVIKIVTKKLDDATAQEFLDQTEYRLASFYEKLKEYESPVAFTINEVNADTGKVEEKTIFSTPKVSAKEFAGIMSGIKKLEIIYGYLYDRVFTTNYQSI